MFRMLRALTTALVALAFIAPRVSASRPPSHPSALVAAAVAPTSDEPAPDVVKPSDPERRLKHYREEFARDESDIGQLVALYRMGETRDFVRNQQEFERMLVALAARPGLRPLVRAEIQALLADQQTRLGDARAAGLTWDRLGVLKHWRAVGPFDNPSPEAIASEAGPERALNLTATYPGKQGKVHWKALPFSAVDGVANLALYFTPAQSASAYLVTWVNSPGSQDVALRLIDSGATRAWVDGALVFEERGSHRTSGFDMHAAAAHLSAGWNEILIKAGAVESGNWRFSARLTTPAGAPLLLVSTDVFHGSFAGRAAPKGAVEPADLVALAKRESNTPGGQLRYAWVLAKKSAFHAGDDADIRAFEAAIATQPNDTGMLLDFAEHDRDSSRRFRTIQRVLALDGHNARALIDRGWEEVSRHEYWPARDDFQGAIGEGVEIDQPFASLGLMSAYAGFGIHPEVLRVADELRSGGYARAPRVASMVSGLLRSAGYAQQALQWSTDAFAADRGNSRAAVDLANLQRLQGNYLEALRTLRVALALNPQFPYLYEVQARAFAGLGRTVEALNSMHRAVSFDSDNPALHIAAGELEQQFGHNEQALREWQVAARLNPQDSDLRDRIRLAQGSTGDESFERPYRIELAKAMQDYRDNAWAQKQSGPVVVLADSTVNRVFPSGNVGRFVQQIFRVNNDVGAQSLAVYSVTYDPATEDVRFLSAHVVHADGSTADAPEADDSTVSESVGYETFYDVRNKFVRMPAIQPGDFVEIAYRVMPTTLESLYGDYYGDIEELQGDAAKVLQQFVVILPGNKNLYPHAVRFAGQSKVSEAAGQRIYRWTMRNTPALVAEPNSPPPIEQIPYVAVTSFKDWEQFGRWYTQLIRDTFVSDEQLRQTTDKLVKGVDTMEGKVDAIYSYVIRSTHYVALEFGIHGYRPYPVAQVFHRRFGDCKDKASLLIAMLARAGVPAELVLVRTRDRGLLERDIPAVADFDHAIVYVPALKRYLDGTAEYNGAQELPAGDQRAFVLRLPVLGAADLGNVSNVSDDPPAKASLAPDVVPELPAQANVATRQLTGTLDAGGNLVFDQHLIIAGEDAPAMRQALQLRERQTSALQYMLRNALPGISVTAAEVAHSDDYDKPIEVKFTGSVPRFASVDGESLLVPRQVIAVSWLSRMASLAQRKSDVLLAPPQRAVDDVTLTLPAGSRVNLPPDLHVDSKFAEVTAAARAEGGKLMLHTAVETKMSYIPVAEYASFRKFWATVDADLGHEVRITR